MDQHCRCMDLDGMDVKFHSNHPQALLTHISSALAGTSLVSAGMRRVLTQPARTAAPKCHPLMVPCLEVAVKTRGSHVGWRDRTQLTVLLGDSAKHTAKGCELLHSQNGFRCQTSAPFMSRCSARLLICVPNCWVTYSTALPPAPLSLLNHKSFNWKYIKLCS